MLTLNKEFLNIFKQVLKYLEKYYLPEKCNCYTDKFEMISNHKPIDENVILGECIIDLTKIDWDKKAEAIKQKKSQENMFCKNIITYLNNDLEQLQDCCKKAHLSANTFEKICNGIFSPTKACVCNLIIAAKLNFEQAVELFNSANIECYQCNKFDVVMAFFFENEIYNFNIINTTLYLLDLPMLGYYYV